METATIYFADNSYVTVKEKDIVSVIIEDPDNENEIVEQRIPLTVNTNNGLVHDLVNIFFHYSLFRIADKNIVYNVSSIVKIKQD